MSRNRTATLVGGGIGTLAAAAFMIRDGGMAGSDITILDALPVMGGSLMQAARPRWASSPATSPARVAW